MKIIEGYSIKVQIGKYIYRKQYIKKEDEYFHNLQKEINDAKENIIIEDLNVRVGRDTEVCENDRNKRTVIK